MITNYASFNGAPLTVLREIEERHAHARTGMGAPSSRLTARLCCLRFAQLVGLGALERMLRLLGGGFGGARFHVAPDALTIFSVGRAVPLTFVL